MPARHGFFIDLLVAIPLVTPPAAGAEPTSAPSSAVLAGLYDDGLKVAALESGEPGIYKFIVTQTVSSTYGQAQSLTDPNLSELYDRVTKDYKPLRDLLASIYEDGGCAPDGRYADPKLGSGFCGVISPMSRDNTVLWSFGRGGWDDAVAQYKTFLTFTSDGSGHYTDAVLEFSTTVSVQAQGLSEPVQFLVEIRFYGFKRIVVNSEP